MIESIRFSIGGSHDILEQLLTKLEVSAKIADYPARSRVYLTVPAGSDAQHTIEDFAKRFALDVGRYSQLTASEDELRKAPLFRNVACSWIEDDETIVDPPIYTGSDRCPVCGRGSREHAEPLRGGLRGIKRDHLIRLPPALVLGSGRLVSLIREHRWTGVDIRPYIDRATGSESGAVSELWITSILPPMHDSARIERSPTPDYCAECRRLGYQLAGPQPVYDKRVVEAAADWNLSEEWLAPHYVSCPKLICSNRVVNELLKLEKTQRWIPVKLVD